MPIAHVLVGADGDHVANAAAGNQLFQLVVEGGVAQHVADDNLAGAVLGHFQNLLALVQLGGDGLLHEDVIALAQGGDGVAHMLAVHGGDHHHIGQLLLLQHFLGAGEAVLLGDVVELAGLFHLAGVQVCHRNHFHLFGEQLLHGGVGAAAVTETGNGKGNRRFHIQTSFLYIGDALSRAHCPALCFPPYYREKGGKSQALPP